MMYASLSEDSALRYVSTDNYHELGLLRQVGSHNQVTAILPCRFRYIFNYQHIGKAGFDFFEMPYDVDWQVADNTRNLKWLRVIVDDLELFRGYPPFSTLQREVTTGNQ